MVSYIKEVAKNWRLRRPFHWTTEDEITPKVLAEELARLDPRDFLPDARAKFVMLRANVLRLSHGFPYGRSVDYSEVKNMKDDLIKILDHYAGEGSRTETRKFPFIHDEKLREIVERDYKELSLILLPDGAWKSTVVRVGSILEAILYDCLSADSAKSMTSTKAPKISDIADWKLHKMIEVATDIGVIPFERAETFDRVLRDYRNFVHPNVEIRAEHPCTEAEAYMAKGALDAVCNFLTK